MERLLPPFTLLLVVLLFPGFSRATYANYQGTKGPGEPKGDYPGQETSKSRLLRHQVKRYLLPRTPPFQEPEPDFKVINCKRSEGRCQNFCNYMEMQIGYCSKNKDPCCLPQN